MLINTPRGPTGYARLNLQEGEMLVVCSDASMTGFPQPVVEVRFSHRVFANGAVGTVLTFEGKPFIVDGHSGIVIMPKDTVTGDMFIVGDDIFFALDKLPIPKDLTLSDLADKWREPEDDDR